MADCGAAQITEVDLFGEKRNIVALAAGFCQSLFTIFFIYD
jgi:hypothetical protein